MGYALDDSSRALIVYLLYGRVKHAEICLGYIEESFKENKFIGFFDEHRKPIVFPSSLDAAALTYWALAFAADLNFEDERSLSILTRFKWEYLIKEGYVRPLSYLLIAMCHLKDKETAASLVTRLMKKYKRTNVNWYEDRLFYANAIIPYSLLFYIRTFKVQDKEIVRTVKESIDTLEKEMRIGVIPAPAGNRKWHKIGDVYRDIYGQQPIDPAFMVILLSEAFKHFSDSVYFAKAEDWMNWFYGNNILRKTLITQENACSDGLDEQGINEDTGAESSLMYLWARYKFKEALNLTEKP